MIDNDSKGELTMALAFPSQIQESSEGLCQDFEPVLPGNIYSFCKHATFWIDGQRGRTCPFTNCSCFKIYSPILYGVYCNKVGNK
jgi:hypothetical protein